MNCPKCLSTMQKDLNSGKLYCIPCLNTPNNRGKYNVAAKEDRTYQGIVFDSKAEMTRYIYLKSEEKAERIHNLQRQTKFPIIGTQSGYKICDYIADFTYLKNGRSVVEDVKGVKTALYSLKKKLVKEYYNVDITEVKP